MIINACVCRVGECLLTLNGTSANINKSCLEPYNGVEDNFIVNNSNWTVPICTKAKFWNKALFCNVEKS